MKKLLKTKFGNYNQYNFDQSPVEGIRQDFRGHLGL